MVCTTSPFDALQLPPTVATFDSLLSSPSRRWGAPLGCRVSLRRRWHAYSPAAGAAAALGAGHPWQGRLATLCLACACVGGTRRRASVSDTTAERATLRASSSSIRVARPQEMCQHSFRMSRKRVAAHGGTKFEYKQVCLMPSVHSPTRCPVGILSRAYLPHHHTASFFRRGACPLPCPFRGEGDSAGSAAASCERTLGALRARPGTACRAALAPTGRRDPGATRFRPRPALGP